MVGENRARYIYTSNRIIIIKTVVTNIIRMLAYLTDVDDDGIGQLIVKAGRRFPSVKSNFEF